MVIKAYLNPNSELIDRYKRTIQFVENQHLNFNSAFNDLGLRLDLLKYVNCENISILDVGCATGVNGNWLRKNKIPRWYRN